MGDLSETEIFDCLATNFRLAAEHAEDLAKLPAKGPTYIKFRHELKMIEGAARQAAHWRQDARFLSIGIACAKAHATAGEWLRGIRMPDGSRRKLARGEVHPSFMTLAAFLRKCHFKADGVKGRRTGRSAGPYLPPVLPGPHRDTRPAGWNTTPSGLIVPEHATVQ